MSRCDVCFRHCEIGEGEIGFCGARTCRMGKVVSDNYGKITALALDPIEKKPLARYMPGKLVLSVGSYGCNLRCPFCQNSDISWSERAFALSERAEQADPYKLADIAESLLPEGNIGIAYTYNEPLVGFEFVRDTAKLVHERGMKNVLVTNGTCEIEVLDEILPYIDAMNVDLKGFSESYYRDILKGDRDAVLRFIERAAAETHVEITTLIVPGLNDSLEEMEKISGWIKSVGDIPLHITRFFPQFNMTDRDATNVKRIYELRDIAGENLTYVYTGNC